MTAIAYRDGVMAADTACWSGSIAIYHVKKIARVNGHLVSAAGMTALCHEFQQWVAAGMNGDFDRDGAIKADIDFDGIIVFPDGRVLKVEKYGAPVCYPAPFHAVGAAQDIMVGAMAAGATAEQAVKIAITYTDHAAGGIQVEKLHNDELVEKIVGAPFPAAA